MTTPSIVAEAKGALPGLGHAIALVRDPRAFLLSLPAYGDLVQIRLGPSKAIVVCDPELTHQVLVNDRIFDKGGPFIDRAQEFIGESVLTLPRSRHRRQRRLLQPAFNHQRFPAYAELMMKEIDAVLDSWHDGDLLEAYTSMKAITTRITARTMFAAPMSQDLIDEAGETLDEIIASAGKRMLIPPPLDRLPTPGKRRYDRARARIRRITDQLIADYRKAGVDHNDLMSMLLAADEDGQTLSEEEISNQVVTMFIGGVETTASALGWALCLLAEHPEAEKRLHEEVHAVVGSRPPTWEDLPKLEYTTKVINEALRMYPAGWLLTKMTTADSELGGISIPKGRTVIYSPYLLGNRPEMFPEPDRFDPDRWVDGARIPRGAFVPFSGGPRKCIGDDFAMVEARLALAAIASRWQIHSAEPDYRPARRISITLTPGKHRVRVTER